MPNTFLLTNFYNLIEATPLSGLYAFYLKSFRHCAPIRTEFKTDFKEVKEVFMYKLCPDCCMDYETDKDKLRCCLDHLETKEEIEEYAWELWGEVRAYKAGVKTLQAEKARLELSLRAEQAVVKELVAGLTEVSEGLEGLKP